MGRRLRGGALSIDGPSTAERRRSLAVANVLVRPIADIGSRCESPAVWAGQEVTLQQFSRRSVLAAFGLTAVSACVGQPSISSGTSNLSLAEVIKRHTSARGGAARLDVVHALSTDVAITEKGSTLQAHYSCNDSPAWRIDVYAQGQHVFCEGLDEAGPWLWPAGDSSAHQAVPDAKKTGIQGIEFNLYGLHRFPQRGHVLSLDGRELLDGVDYYVIKVVMKDSYETYLYISPTTWMIDRRRDFRAFHPDIDPKKAYAEKRYGDFRTVDGIVSPFSENQVNWKTGEEVNSTLVNSIVYNPRFEPGELTRSYRAPASL